MQNETNPDVIFFSPDITDASGIKRVESFIAQGCSLLVFGFRRRRFDRPFTPPWPCVVLGETQDADYGQRAKALLWALPLLFVSRCYLQRASSYYARNLDQLILAWVARLCFNWRARIVYEVLDIQPVMTRAGLMPALLRTVERLLLRGIELLVLSSPGFYRNYFVAVQRYRGDWFLLENKLHAASLADRPTTPGPAEAARRNRWVIGYFGTIRGQATFDLMVRIAERLPDKILFKFRGVVTTVDPERFAAAIATHGNMVFEGAYEAPQDLPAMYREIDFTWALDLENTQSNSRWLLPCRFYEAGLFGVPCLGVRDFEVGAAIERYRIGWTFDFDAEAALEESLVDFFVNVSPEDYDRCRRNIRELPLNVFVGGDELEILCRRLTRRKPALLPRRLTPAPASAIAALGAAPIGMREV